MVLSMAVMSTSMSRGRLAFYPRMDDVLYMARGAELTQAGQQGWERGGAVGAIKAIAHDWKRQPPHSPWSSGAAAIGFGVCGYREWAAYVPTALPVLGFLLCAAKLARGAGGRWNWRAHALVMFATTAPFLAASMYNLKPDYAAGICAAIAMMKALRGPLLAAPWRRLVWMGAMFGLSLLVKPAMMLPTGMLAAGTLAICTVRDLALRRMQGQAAEKPLLRACRAWVLVLGTMVLVAVPHFVFALRGELDYMRGTLTGEGIEMWGYRGSWIQHATYYLTGPGGHLMLDGARSLVPLGLALTLFGCIAFFARSPSASPGRSRRRMVYFVATLAAIAMAWAGPTLSTVKISQFASCFTALLWLAGVHAAAGVCRAARELAWGWLRRPLVASLLVGAMFGGSLATYRWTFPLWPGDRSEPARAARDARDEFVRRTYEAVKAECGRVGEAGRGAKSILVAGGQRDLAWELLTLWCIRDGVPLQIAAVERKPNTVDKAEADRIGRALLEGRDLLLVGQGIARKDRPKVIHTDADEFYLGLVRADARFELITRLADPGSGAVFELYRRRAGP